ncbi:MAG: MFS transporter, partial [Candidatus Hodarchaeota archaeon]
KNIMVAPTFHDKQEHLEYLEKFKINQKRAMFTIILSILLDIFGYTMVLPLLPIIAKDFGASDFMIGILISSNALASLIFIPIWGKLSDKYGRKPILVISQAGTCVSFLILGLSNTIYIILFARILDGVFGGQIPVIRAYITDITTPQTRATHMGKIMVGYTLGMTIGPLVGGFFGAIHWRFPPYFASALSILSIIMTIKIIVESMPKERRAEIKAQLLIAQTNPEEKRSIWNKEVISRMTQMFLVSLISFIFTSSFALVLDKRYNADPSVIGLVMAVAGVAVMIYGGILIKPLIKKIGEKRLLITTFILFIITFEFYAYLFELWMVFIFILPYSFCIAFMRPLITSNMTKAVGLDKQGELSGWSSNLQAFSQTIAPLISTGFLQLGGLTIGLMFSYFLIGFTNVVLAIILFLIGYIDIMRHPKLYYYERLRKKRKAMQKRRKTTDK